MALACVWTSATVAARSGQVASTTAPALIDVPYLSQTPELCGGAALAMVLRYWGAADVFAQDFAPLVDRAERGIRGDALAGAARERGWQATPAQPAASTSLSEVGGHVNRGRPIIALIEERPGLLHYVVVLGLTPEHVVVHDPARAPFRTLPRADFERRWAATSRWMMLVLPAPGSRQGPALAASTAKGPDSPSTPSAVSTSAPASPVPGDSARLERESRAEAAVSRRDASCPALVNSSVQLARDGDVNGAESGLLAAIELCPAHAPAWSELAGLRFVQSRYDAARDYAERAVEIDPGDAHAWELLGATRFLHDDQSGALAAWNHQGQPRVDTISVTGASRTDHPVIVRLTGLQPRQLLTAEAFARAARRLDDLPAAAETSLRYAPQGRGTVDVEALVRERRVLPSGLIGWSTVGARALLKDEVVIDVAGPTGAGEIWRGAWRWQENRPRLAFDLLLPAPPGAPGIVRVEAMWERQAYAPSIAPGVGDALYRAERRRGGLTVGDWISSRVRWSAGAALDQFDRDRFIATHGGVDVRVAGDRLALVVDGSVWSPLGDAFRFHRMSVLAAWRTDPGSKSSWNGEVGGTLASRNSPLAVWPAGDTGANRDVLLRGHSLHENGVVTGDVVGRQIARASLEHHQRLYEGQFGRTTLVGFIDAARAWQRARPDVGRDWHVDVGVGMRIAPPGGGGTLRLDLGYGLRDGGIALSAGWVGRWPQR